MTSTRLERPGGLERLLVGGLATLLVVAAWIDYGLFRRGEEEAVSVLLDAGFERRSDGVVDRVEHERAEPHARLAAARALVYAVVAPESGELAASGTAVGGRGSAAWLAAVGRLPRAAELARQALAAQPGSWQAAMFLGAAIFLERSLARDPRVYTAAADWEAPLAAAVRQAPGQAEPRRFLAAAYLEVWPALSAPKREVARGLLRTAFAHDAAAFERLAPSWLAVAEDLDQAFAVMPDRPAVWRALEATYARSHRWEAFRRARERERRSLLAASQQRLAEAEERLRLGDLFHGRSLLLTTVAEAPVDGRFAPVVARALELYPPGLHGLASTEALRAWLRYALELSALDRDPLPAHVVGRLASAAGDVAPPVAAHAAIVAGEIPQAERLERLAQHLASEEWGPYLLAKARWHLRRHEGDEAAQLLVQAGGDTRRTLPFALTAVELAKIRGDAVALAEAEARLDTWRRREWSAAEWRFRDGRALLPLLPAGGAAGIAVTLNRVPAGGAVVELFWDGESVIVAPLEVDAELALHLPVDAGPHLLELRMAAGERVLPGRVRLLESSG